MNRLKATVILLAALVVGPPATADVLAPGSERRSVEVFAPDGTIARIEVPATPEPPVPQEELDALEENSSLTPIHVSGPSANRFDLVILGDGYTSAQVELFRTQARQKWDTIASFEPFKTYKTFFNVWAVDVISAESGVDNDPYPPTARNTALDMQFWCNGTERLLCVNSQKASAAASPAPPADQILVLANSTKYGGAGGGIATSSGGNFAAGLITVHELGHSIGGLADEYDYYYRAGLSEDAADDVTIPAPYLLYPGAVLGEPSGANITAKSDPQQLVTDKLKWWRWVGETSPDGGPVGTYEGGGYYRYGIYRPSQDSLMHTLGIKEGGNPFNSPSLEEMTRAFFRKVRPIDSRTPNNIALGPQTVAIEVVEPATRSYTITWFLDGHEVASAAGRKTFDLTEDQVAAHQTLSVKVHDDSPFVRNPSYIQNDLTQQVTWTI